MAAKIFVNYRRDDSPGHAISVAQYLEAALGKRNVFIDVDRMRAGQNFPSVLKERLAASKVMLAVIGPSWLSMTGEDGRRRLDDPGDWVRLEIAMALTSGIAVIPVLVGGASLPRRHELPSDLQGIVDQHAVTITTNGFRNEMAGLARDIKAMREPLPWKLIGGGAAAAAVVVLGWLGLVGLFNSETSGTTSASARVESLTSANLGATDKQRASDIQAERERQEASLAREQAELRKAEVARAAAAKARAELERQEALLAKEQAELRKAEAARVAASEARAKAETEQRRIAALNENRERAPPTEAPISNSANTLVIELKSGPVRIQLLPDLAPKHVARVKQLAKENFYNGIKFHRVIDGFMAQTGDPTGTGTGGSKYGNLPAEFSKYVYKRGTVGAARTQDPNSANSQFYICFNDDGCRGLTGQYTVWGQVISGMEHVDKIKRGAPGSGTVTDPDVMQKVYLLSDKK